MRTESTRVFYLNVKLYSGDEEENVSSKKFFKELGV